MGTWAKAIVLVALAVHACVPVLGSDRCKLNATSKGVVEHYDIFVLAMQWPASACVFLNEVAGDACRSPPAAFVVRGLWPTRLVGTQPRCCLVGDFSIAAIADLIAQLRHLWPVLQREESATDLWATQWRMHGSCSGLSCRSYFRRVVELARRFDFLRALSAQGIVASDHRTHKLSSVQRALDAAVGGPRVRVRCRQSKKGTVLDAVHVCLDSAANSVVNCPSTCFEGDDACCDTGQRLRIPFWSHDSQGSPLGNYNTSYADDDTSNDRNESRGRGSSGGSLPDPAGYWTGQVVGVVALLGGVFFWIFKNATLDRRRTGTGTVDGYQRIQ